MPCSITRSAGALLVLLLATFFAACSSQQTRPEPFQGDATAGLEAEDQSVLPLLKHRVELPGFESSEVRAMVFHPTEPVLVTAGPHEVCVWCMESGLLLWRAEEIGKQQRSLAFSKDGKWLAVGDYWGHVHMVEYADKKLMFSHTIETHWDAGPIRSLSFSHDGLLLAGAQEVKGSDDKIQVLVWSTVTTMCLYEFEPVRESRIADGLPAWLIGSDGEPLLVRWIDSSGWSSDGTLKDQAVSLWSPRKDNTSKAVRLVNEDGWVQRARQARVASSGKQLDVYIGNGFVVRLSLSLEGSQDDEVAQTLNKEDLDPESTSSHWKGTAYSDDGAMWATKCLSSGHTEIYDTDTGRRLHLLGGNRADPWSVAYSHDGKRIATGGSDGRVMLWDAETGKLLESVGPRVDPDEENEVDFGLETNQGRRMLASVAFSPDGKWLAVGDGRNRIRLLDPNTLEEQRVLWAHYAPVMAIAFHSNGKQFASGSYDGTVRLWDTSDWSQTGLIKHYGSGNGVLSIQYGNDDGPPLIEQGATSDEAWADIFPRTRYGRHAKFPSPEGNLILHWGDGSIEFHWSGEIRAPKEVQGKHLLPRCFSSNSKSLVVTSRDVVILFNTDTGDEAARIDLSDTDWLPEAVAFRPDSKEIAVALSNGSVRLYPLKGE